MLRSQDIILSATLTKQPVNARGLIRVLSSSRSRFMVLCDSEIRWYRSDQEVTVSPLGSMSLAAASVERGTNTLTVHAGKDLVLSDFASDGAIDECSRRVVRVSARRWRGCAP